MKTPSQRFRHHRQRCLTKIALLLQTLSLFSSNHAHAGRWDAFTSGGGRSSSGLYANQASLGQLGATTVRGGPYSMAGGQQSIQLRSPEPPPVPGAPRISLISDQVMPEDGGMIEVPFRVSDPDTPAGQLALGRLISDPNLFRLADVTLGGTGSNRVIRLTPRTNAFGNAVITIGARDPQSKTANRSFMVDVIPVNDPPVILTPDPMTVEAGTQAVARYRIGDVDDPEEELSVEAVSDQPFLISPDTFLFEGEGFLRDLSFTPAAGGTGTAWLTLKVSDPQGATAAGEFRVTVTASLDVTPPRITRWLLSSNGKLQLSATAAARSRVIIESTESMGPAPEWKVEAQTTVGADGDVRFEHAPSVLGSRFFRVRIE